MREEKVVESEFAIARESAIITWVLSGRDAKTGRRKGNLQSGKKGSLKWDHIGGCWHGKLQIGKPEVGHPTWLTMSEYLAFSGSSKVESRDKIQRSCQLLSKSWPFGTNCYRSYYFPSWIIIRDTNLASYKSDLYKAGFLAYSLQIKGLVS